MAETALQLRIRTLIEDGIAGGKHKGGFAIYGNAKCINQQYFVGVGSTNAAGGEWSPLSIIRYASQSKLIGALALAKCIEEGIVSLDDKLSTYVPEFNTTLRYYNANGALNPELFDGNLITLNHLVSMSSGLNYYFPAWGNLYRAFNPLTGPLLPFTQSNKTRNVAVNSRLRGSRQFWDWQFDPTIWNAFQNPSFKFPTFKLYIQNIVRVPLAFKPGSTSNRQAVYGLDMDILGAALNVAVQAKGYPSIYNYVQVKLLAPMGIDDVFQIGNSAGRPADVASRLVETAFRRPPGNLQPDSTVFAPDPSLDYLATHAGELVWATEYNDGFRYNEDLFLLTGPSRFFGDSYQGYFGAGWVGSIRSFCKFLILIFGNGVYDCTRIISQEALQLVLTPSLPEYRSFALYRLTNPCVSNSLTDVADPALEGLFVVPYNEHWNIGCSGGNTAFSDVMYSNRINRHSITWGSYYGTSFAIDLESGNYVMAGIQEDANSLAVPDDDARSWTYKIFPWLNL